jgi:O6-methylguanine-DNA--protein-cysteine methyltransferase
MEKTKGNEYQRVYSLLKSIPGGKVTTYGAIGKKLCINPRFVGRILSENGHPKEYPCYKVIRSDGNLGGYTLGDANDKNSIVIKKRKLMRDGIELKGDKVPDRFILRKL